MRSRFVATIAAAGLVLAPACSSDEPDSGSAGRQGSTTTAADGATGGSTAPSGATGTETTDAAGEAAPGGPAPSIPDSFVVPGEESPLELGTGAPEPEYPSGQDGTVAAVGDGKLDIRVVQVDGATGTLLVDVVELVVGDGARAAAEADGVLRPGEDLVGNYYVRNGNPKMRVVEMSADVRLAERGGPGASGRADVTDALIERLSIAPGIPYAAVVRNGEVVELTIPEVEDPTLGAG